MKRMLLGIALAFSTPWADEEKVSYLPPYEPHSSVSPKVQEFLDAALLSNLEQNTIASSYDVLGRKKRRIQFTTPYSIVLRQAKMDVLVSFLDIPEKDERTISAEYRFENGARQYWLNGVTISEEDYFNIL